MPNKNDSGSSYYQIVKYNVRTRKDLSVLPRRFQVLSEVNQKIEVLNAELRASNKDESGEIIYFRRKVHV